MDVHEPAPSVKVMNDARWAAEVARKLLAKPLPRRWAHTQGVARRARSIAGIVGEDADLIEAAAWLHDIGYSPELVVTGFHPLDGARYLRDVEDADERLCGLVAYHSCAINEATERGLTCELTREFKPANQVLSDALTYCDMTTTPDGRPVMVEDRLTEIHSRYGEQHLVSRSIKRSSPHILGSVRAIEGMQLTAAFA